MKAHKHWLWQRITAILFTILLALTILTFTVDFHSSLPKSKIIIPAIILTSLIGLWHSVFGIEAICEDYIHNLKLRNVTLLIVKSIVAVSCLLGIISLLCLMVL